MSQFEISAPAVAAVAALRHSGYLGLALLSDPATGHLVLFRSEASSCKVVAHVIVRSADGPHVLVELPALVIGSELTPFQALTAARAELRRVAKRAVN